MKRFYSTLKESGNINQTVCSSNSNEESSPIESEFEEPHTKRFAPDPEPSTTLLVEQSKNENLADELSCIICLDLPPSEIFQCVNGHSMCKKCYARILESARCPICRVTISGRNRIRNFVAERILADLPEKCAYCNELILRIDLERHENELCDARPTQCKYRLIGCDWSGTYAELNEHEQNCRHRHRLIAFIVPLVPVFKIFIEFLKILVETQQI